MNTDFRVSVDFFAHHKTRKLRRKLGADAVLCLLQLWAYAARLRADGNLSGMSTEDVELAADWDGDEGALVSGLIAVGYIDGDEGDYTLHDWAENNPWVAEAKTRSDKAKKGAAARWSKREQPEAECGEQPEQCSSNAQAMHEHELSNAPSPSPEEKNSLSTPLTPHATDVQQPEEPPMPSLEWQELRAYYDEHARTEGPMEGYGDYLAAKGAKAWPGQTAVYDAIDRWKASGQWDEDGVPRFAPGLGKFIARRLWNAHPTPKPKREPPRGYGGTSQPPRATTQAQVISQSKDRIARDVAARRGIDVDAVLGKTAGIAGGNSEWAAGQHARLPVGERN